MPYFLHIIEYYDSLSCYLLVIFKRSSQEFTTKVQFITKKVQLVVAFFRLIIIDRAAVKRVSWSQIWRKWWPLNDLAGWSVFNTSKSNFDNILAVSSSCQMMKGVWFSKTFAILKYLSTRSAPLLCATISNTNCNLLFLHFIQLPLNVVGPPWILKCFLKCWKLLRVPWNHAF